MDDERLKNLGGGSYYYELLDSIKEIRSSEKVLYRQVLDLYSTAIDYNPKEEETIKFLKLFRISFIMLFKELTPIEKEYLKTINDINKISNKIKKELR